MKPVIIITIAFVLLLPVSVFAQEDPAKITVTIIGDSVINLDSSNKLLRANVEIENYNPQEGYYYMQIVHTQTGTIIKESEIFPKYYADQLWTVPIAFMITNDVQLGIYEIQIRTEFGSQTAKAEFSILESAPEPEPETASEPESVPVNESTIITSKETSIPKIVSEPTMVEVEITQNEILKQIEDELKEEFKETNYAYIAIGLFVVIGIPLIVVRLIIWKIKQREKEPIL